MIICAIAWLGLFTIMILNDYDEVAEAPTSGAMYPWVPTLAWGRFLLKTFIVQFQYISKVFCTYIWMSIFNNINI